MNDCDARTRRLDELFEELGHLPGDELIHEAVGLADRIVGCDRCPRDRAWALLAAGNAYTLGAGALDGAALRDRAVHAFRSAIVASSVLSDAERDAVQPLAHGQLGELLIERAEESTPAARPDVDAAIECLEAVLPQLEAGSGERDQALLRLGHAYSLCQNEAQRLPLPVADKVIQYYGEVWPTLHPVEDEGVYADVAWRLARAYSERLEQCAPTVRDTEGAVETWTAVYESCARAGEIPSLVTVFLGLALSSRAQLGRLPADQLTGDLDRAIEFFTLALEELPQGDLLRGHAVGGLASAFVLGTNWGLPTPPDRAERIIRSLRQALADPPADATLRGSLHLTLGMALFLQDWTNLDPAIEQLTLSAENAVSGIQASAVAALAEALLMRYQHRGALVDLDAADHHYAELQDQSGFAAWFPPAELVLFRVRRLQIRAMRQGARQRREELESTLNEIQAALEELPVGHPIRSRVTSDLTVLRAYGAVKSGNLDSLSGTTSFAELAETPASGVLRDQAVIRQAGLRLVVALHRGDREEYRDVLAELERHIETMASGSPFRSRFAGMLGLGLVHPLSGQLHKGIRWLEVAREGVPSGFDELPGMLITLAGAYRTRGAAGDDARWREAAHAGLRQFAYRVLLQTGAERGLVVARSAAAEAKRVAEWCVAAGDLGSAVGALELGRALVLHSSTSSAVVPDLLAEKGHADLAAGWKAASDRTTPWDAEPTGLGGLAAGLPELPDALRQRVLDVLAGSRAEQLLLHPPDVAEIGAALRKAGADALVYLLPKSEHTSGRAVVISAQDGVTTLPLPGLDVDVADGYADFVDVVHDIRTAEGRTNRERWRRALERLCDWAWPAAVSPLLAEVRSAGTPHVVLVPLGRLDAVPWHAARRSTGAGEVRYACQDAVFTYAASGRQFIETAHREYLPFESDPVVVGMIDFGLRWERHATDSIRNCYPNATVLTGDPRGAEGSADPETVLTHVPGEHSSGASVLHLGCHAGAADLPLHSALDLRGGSRLQVDRVLRQARGRPPNAPGGLVVLPNCTSNVSRSDHDEALTVATAFLAAGAAGVAGTRWLVWDRATALMMTVFHHYLTTSHPAPALALHAAQLWMLDPKRTKPDRMTPRLAEALHDQNFRPSDIENWAGFGFQGQTRPVDR
ncbi:CHAT domain-containing protein [Flindersiella endophytica]